MLLPERENFYTRFQIISEDYLSELLKQNSPF